MTAQEKFEAAVNVIRSLPKDGPYQPSHDMMLKFYALYKQAVVGPCEEPKPAFYEVVKGYKWRAWNNLGSMSKTEAMKEYVEELKKIIETMAYTEDVAKFIDVLGAFYEYVHIPGKVKGTNNNSMFKGSESDEENGRSEGMDSRGSPFRGFVANGVSCHMNGIPVSGKGEKIDEDSCASTSSLGNTPNHLPLHNGAATFVGNGIPSPASDDNTLVDSFAGTVIKSVGSSFGSDTDSDEEYSEPAEMCNGFQEESHISTELILQNVDVILDEERIEVEVIEPTEAVTTYGGGDKPHPGGLQMTPPPQSVHGASRHRSISRGEHSFDAGASPSQSLGGTWGGQGGGTGSGGGGGQERIPSRASESATANLAIVLQRIQADLNAILLRLNSLESVSASNHHEHHCCQCQRLSQVSRRDAHSERSWWPFPELSPRSTFFLLIWPFLLHGGIKLLVFLREHRRQQK